MQQPGKFGEQGRAQDMIAAGDAYGARGLVAHLRQHIQLRFYFIEAIAYRVQQPLARDGRRNAAGGPRQ
ncbi:hypothetical protein D3C84_911200 [compost metagenome]